MKLRQRLAAVLLAVLSASVFSFDAGKDARQTWWHRSLAQVDDGSNTYEQGSERSQLRSELVIAEHKQNGLRHRLTEISEVAHEGLMELHTALEAAKGAASKSLNKLRSQLDTTQHSTAQLRQQLSSEQRAAAAASAKLSAVAKLNGVLHVQLAGAQRASTQLVASEKVQAELRAKEAAVEAAQLSIRGNLVATERLAGQLAASEKSAVALRSQIVASERSEASDRAVAAATEQTLRDQLEHILNSTASEQVVAGRVESNLRQHLARAEQDEVQRQIIANRTQNQLRAKLQLTEQVKRELLGQITASRRTEAQLNLTLHRVSEQVAVLQHNLTDANHSNAQVKAQLSAQEKSLAVLQQNASKANASASEIMRSAHHVRLVFLNKVAEAHEKADLEEQAATVAENHTKAAQEHASKSLSEHRARAEQEALEHKRDVMALKDHVHAAEAELNATQQAEKLAKNKSSVLVANLSLSVKKLKAALLQTDALQSDRDKIQTNVETLRRKALAAETAFTQTRSKVTSAEQALSEARAQLSAQLNATDSLSSEVASLQKQLAKANKTLSSQAEQARKQLEAVQTDAASQLKSLTAANSSLRAEIVREHATEDSALAAAAKAKDTLVQETNLALDSSRRADALSQSLQDLQHASESNGTRLNSLQGEVEELRSERNRVSLLLTQRTKENADWQTKESALENSSKAVSLREKTAAAENQRLRKELQDLSGQADRVQQLTDMISALRAGMQKNASRRAGMARELADLRELKDRYSSEYEAWRNESDTWHSRATELDGRLETEEKRLKAAERLRDEAAEKAKEASSHDDEYSRENANLHQADDAMQAQLLDVSAAAKRSAEAEHEAQQRMNALKAEEKKRQDEYNGAWMKNEHELIEARHDLKEASSMQSSLESDLAHARALLNDKQRKALGLPIKHAKAKVGHSSAQPPAEPSVAPVEAAIALVEPSVAPAEPSAAPVEPSTTFMAAHNVPVRPAIQTQSQMPAPLHIEAPSKPHAVVMAQNLKSTKPKSTLQALAAYFASPLP